MKEAKSKRPKKRVCGPVHLRVIRGPNAGGQWYWQGRMFEEAGERTVWSGWGTVTEADQQVAAIVARDGLGKQEKKGDRADTVAALMALFVGSQEENPLLAFKTKASRRVAGVHLTRTVGRTVVSAVTRQTIERHRDLRIREGAAPLTVGLELQIFRLAWRWGVEGGLGPTGELPRVRVGTTTVRDRYTPSRAEIGAVLGKLSGWSGVVFLLLASTGCRIGEIASLTWERVDIEGGWLDVTGKTGARRVPLAPPVAQELFDARPSVATGPVVGLRHNSVVSNLGVLIWAACDAAEVRRFSPHGLRRAAEDALYGTGADVSVSAALMGHSPAVALKHYRQVADSERAKAIKTARLGYFDVPGESGKVVPFKGGGS